MEMLHPYVQLTPSVPGQHVEQNTQHALAAQNHERHAIIPMQVQPQTPLLDHVYSQQQPPLFDELDQTHAAAAAAAQQSEQTEAIAITYEVYVQIQEKIILVVSKFRTFETDYNIVQFGLTCYIICSALIFIMFQYVGIDDEDTTASVSVATTVAPALTQQEQTTAPSAAFTTGAPTTTSPAPTQESSTDTGGGAAAPFYAFLIRFNLILFIDLLWLKEMASIYEDFLIERVQTTCLDSIAKLSVYLFNDGQALMLNLQMQQQCMCIRLFGQPITYALLWRVVLMLVLNLTMTLMVPMLLRK
eukprot:g15698.t1